MAEHAAPTLLGTALEGEFLQLPEFVRSTASSQQLVSLCELLYADSIFSPHQIDAALAIADHNRAFLLQQTEEVPSRWSPL
jgi:hypothetical protein